LHEVFEKGALAGAALAEDIDTVGAVVFGLTFRTLFYTSAAIFAEPPVERRVGAISRLF
jgi:hypothetical protein